jgi:hypothetical protein
MQAGTTPKTSLSGRAALKLMRLRGVLTKQQVMRA